MAKILKHVNDAECEAAGLDPAVVDRIARNLSKAGEEAYALGITIFGGSGNGSLRFDESRGRPALVIAHLRGNFDGGDGQENYDSDGLLRGE